MGWICILLLAILLKDSYGCSENPTLCMMDLLKQWEEFRVKEKDAANVLVPVLYYSHTSLDILCNTYNILHNKCGIEKCENDPVASFVQRNFGYTCANSLKHQECIVKALVGSNCTGLIEEAPKIGGDLHCDKINQFVPCAEQIVKSECGQISYAMVMKTLQMYGCDEKIDIEKVDEFLNISEEHFVETTTILAEIRVTSEDPATSTVEVTTEGTSQEPSSSITEVSPTTTIVEETTSESLKSSTELINEVEGSGEEVIIKTTTTTQSAIRTRKPKRFRAENMTDCYSSILSDFGRFLKATPSSSFIRFPLFGLKPMEVDVLCSKREISQECVDHFCVGNCRHPPIKSFVDAQLNEVCRLKTSDDFELEFTCLQNVLVDTPECLTFINTTSPNRCDGHGHFRNCIGEKIGFGCRLITGFEVEEIESSGDEGSGSEIENGEKNSTEVVEKLNQEDFLLTSINETRNCTGDVKSIALGCLAPLLRLWTGIKANRKDTEGVFPIFQFSKIELLEICDSFINYRNCFQRTNSAICNSQPVVLFAEEHFGQVCTTQTIEASIRTHDCINALSHRDVTNCNRFSFGETLPGKRKCTKVRRYTKCLRKLVKESCGHLMLAHYDNIVDRFGC
ncbi:unnamed protein product [Caenorhabditis angaria]|uniref:DUF19 domain-containing protein n=1 Tax=Caenorhabditis angaria TaxID=860376 RepID=A0A9P1N6A5_9PELO|nr:unnamed protein product [Caenorhabditis angaria]